MKLKAHSQAYSLGVVLLFRRQNSALNNISKIYNFNTDIISSVVAASFVKFTTRKKVLPPEAGAIV